MINENNYRNEAHKAFDNAYPDFFKAFPPELLRLANMAFDFAYGYGREEGREEGRADHFADVSKMINAIIIDGKVYEIAHKGYGSTCDTCDLDPICLDNNFLLGCCQALSKVDVTLNFRYSQELTDKISEK